MVQVENTMTIVSTTAHVNGKSWTDVGWCWCWCWLNFFAFLYFWNSFFAFLERLPTEGSNWPHLVQKTSRHGQGGPTDLLWCKKLDVTHRGVQLTSFGAKNVTSLTGGSKWPFRCLDFYHIFKYFMTSALTHLLYCLSLTISDWICFLLLCLV